MEVIAAARLSKVAEEASLLPEIQIGFRKEKSTVSTFPPDLPSGESLEEKYSYISSLSGYSRSL